MKIKFIVTFCLVAFMSSSICFGQVKIGYTNIELVLVYMPEAKQMERTLSTYQKKLAEKLRAKESYAKSKLAEYLEKKEKNELSPSEEEAREKELIELDKEIQKESQDAEYDLLAKREELLAPILEKVQNAINKVAKEKGFTYILNQTTSSGVSTILFGPDENDITEALMKELGISIPSSN